MPPPIAVIFGAGPGTGAALARALAPSHSLLLMSRSLPGSYSRLALDDLAQDKIHLAQWDGTGSSFTSAITAAQAKWPGAEVKVGICNAGVTFKPGPFLQQTSADLADRLESVSQLWDFSQAVIPKLLEAKGGTLLVTGATMARKASANFSSMAAASFARRALAQSLAREFGPQGVHVAHVVVDGLIDTARVEGMMGKGKEGDRLKPEDIAQVFLDVINQKSSAWTQELDVRPANEKW